MQIKADEDLPKQVVALLRESGYEADSVIEQSMAGWKDARCGVRFNRRIASWSQLIRALPISASIRLELMQELCCFARTRMVFAR